jgi:hypothetical protein
MRSSKETGIIKNVMKLTLPWPMIWWLRTQPLWNLNLLITVLSLITLRVLMKTKKIRSSLRDNNRFKPNKNKIKCLRIRIRCGLYNKNNWEECKSWLTEKTRDKTEWLLRLSRNLIQSKWRNTNKSGRIHMERRAHSSHE